MTLRPLARMRHAAVIAMIGAGMLALAGGCDPRSLMYFLQPFEPKVPPPGPSLKGKKVVVLAHAIEGTYGEFPDLEGSIAKDLGRALEANVRKIEVVPHEKVKLWVDAHPGYTDPSEAARAFEADAVVFLEIEAFQIESPLSPGLFQGLGRVHVKVFNLAAPTDADGEVIPGREKEVIVVHDDYVETTFPRVQGSIPESPTVNRTAFRKKFYDLVVTELSWQFIARAPGDDIQDTQF